MNPRKRFQEVSQMESLCFLIITLYIIGASSLTLIPSANPLAVGDNATVTLTPQMSIHAGSWLFGSNIIVFWYPDQYIVTDDYIGRMSFDLPTSKISLYSVQVSDSGLYKLHGVNPSVKAELTLSVQEPITNVSLTASKTSLVEVNDSVMFTCTAQGTPLVFSWYNGSSLVTAADAQLINNGGDLIINNVTRYDTGPFSCFVANGISNGTSRSISLTVYYGPSNPVMTVLPNMMEYISGSNITLSCSCESKPAALFQWTYNGISLNINTPTFQVISATPNQTGAYACVAQNTVTHRNVTITRSINIIDPIFAAPIMPIGESPVFNNSFALSCRITGRVDTVYWIKNSLHLFPDTRLSLTNQNKTLTFDHLSLSDNGKYQCVASNTVSNVTSIAYNLIVNYGPWSTNISGPDKDEVGANVTLTCSASSQPVSQYSWFFQGSKVAEGSVYQTDSLSLNSSGEYTCKAHNNITGINSSATQNLTVIVGISSVVVTPSNHTPLASKNMQLFCNVTGFFNSIQWRKNNQPLNTKSIYLNDTTIDFYPLQITDDGLYQCVATNIFRPHVSPPYRLIVNYGPVNMSITAVIKTSIVLKCNAKSQPLSVYYWLFNNTVIKEEAELVFSQMPPLGNNYTCVAMNPLTNETLSASYVISERNAAAPLQAGVLLTALCTLVLSVLTLMKPL